MKALWFLFWSAILSAGALADGCVISPVKDGVAYPSPDGKLTVTKRGEEMFVRGRGLFGRRYPAIGTDFRVRALLWSRDQKTLVTVLQLAGPVTEVQIHHWDGHQWQDGEEVPDHSEKIQYFFVVSLSEAEDGFQIGYVGYEKGAIFAGIADFYYYRYAFTVDPVTGVHSHPSKKEISGAAYDRLVRRSW